MSNKGRKRRSGKREPSGRLSRSTKDRGTPEAFAHRAAVVGRANASVWDGTQLHSLFLNGLIDQAMLDAGRRFSMVYVKWLRVKGVALPFPKTGKLGVASGVEDFAVDEVAYRAVKRNFEALRCLLKREPRALLAVQKLAQNMAENKDMDMIRLGLIWMKG